MNYLVQPTGGMLITTNCFCIAQCFCTVCGPRCERCNNCLQCSGVCGAKACSGNATPWANGLKS